TVHFGPKTDLNAAMPPMPDHFKILYALAKVIYSPLVTYFVAVQGMSEKDRNSSFSDKLLRLVGI
ncbi:MAG: hypothetical protein HY042_05465, partial [Spirochaetia bacterium]|nr:hypothetical protein [Spirochaetia bacterium]